MNLNLFPNMQITINSVPQEGARGTDSSRSRRGHTERRRNAVSSATQTDGIEEHRSLDDVSLNMTFLYTLPPENVETNTNLHDILQNTQLYIIRDGNEIENCSICQQDSTSQEIWRLIKTCNHTFHYKCIDHWFCDNSTCPICRRNIHVSV